MFYLEFKQTSQVSKFTVHQTVLRHSGMIMESYTYTENVTTLQNHPTVGRFGVWSGPVAGRWAHCIGAVCTTPNNGDKDLRGPVWATETVLKQGPVWVEQLRHSSFGYMNLSHWTKTSYNWLLQTYRTVLAIWTHPITTDMQFTGSPDKQTDRQHSEIQGTHSPKLDRNVSQQFPFKQKAVFSFTFFNDVL